MVSVILLQSLKLDIRSIKPPILSPEDGNLPCPIKDAIKRKRLEVLNAPLHHYLYAYVDHDSTVPLRP